VSGVRTAAEEDGAETTGQKWELSGQWRDVRDQQQRR